MIAPTTILKKPGDRVKTDRRYVRALARLSAAVNYLEPLWVPDTAQEAFRNLIHDRVVQIQRQRQRVGHFLLRHERRFRGAAWTVQRRAWLHDLKFDESADQISLRTKTDILSDLERRLIELEADIKREVFTQSWLPAVASLRALRGVDRLTAVTLFAELGDLRRFPTAPQYMAYLGLTPSEHSSGPK
ncbi:MAG: transposase [Gammaproteobacteria bacterium]|nr:transposase [Gammaproteobacteria bacterium]